MAPSARCDDVLAQRLEVDVGVARADDFEDERPAAAEHQHVDVLAPGPVEAPALGLHRRHQPPRDQLLHRLLRQLAEAAALLAALAAPPVALAARTEEHRLRQAAPQLAVARLEPEIRSRDGLNGWTSGGAGSDMGRAN
jgi:hypothetical protein